MSLAKCRICGDPFELEADPYLWTPTDQCPACRSKLLSGKIIPVLEDGKIVGFVRREKEN
ncbi:hypothetical protein ES702_00475 [subsurface metagenome]